jgi:catechol 2,3-dioxygenase-like lactoylglutathione lyase family enzyme
MSIDKIVLISLPVSDPERAKSFYTEKLGFI